MKIASKAYVLPTENIDTDQIIPAEFLKQIDKKGYGKNLFFNWRYNSDGTPNADFVLNDATLKGAKIIVGGKNFGCGSSREHAAWAVADYGIEAVISSKFADIFKGNAYNNRIIPIELEEKVVDQLIASLHENPQAVLKVDLERQTVTVPFGSITFEIPPFKKKCLIEGIDETEYLIGLKDEIELFEKSSV